MRERLAMGARLQPGRLTISHLAVAEVRRGFLGVLCLIAVTLAASTGPRGPALQAAADAQAPSTLGRRANTWAARSSSGQMFAGTWTASEDVKTGAVTGAWTLIDAQGRTVASGGWSAVKSPKGWTGSWRAVAAGRSGEYAGTWTATIDLKPDTRLNDLFVKAIGATVSGTWKTGGQSGAWTIQAFK